MLWQHEVVGLKHRIVQADAQVSQAADSESVHSDVGNAREADFGDELREVASSV